MVCSVHACGISVSQKKYAEFAALSTLDNHSFLGGTHRKSAAQVLEDGGGVRNWLRKYV